MAVFEQMTVQENVDYFCGLYVPEKKKRKELVEEALAFTGLENFRKKDRSSCQASFSGD